MMPLTASGTLGCPCTLAKVIDTTGHWSGGTTVLVQVAGAYNRTLISST